MRSIIRHPSERGPPSNTPKGVIAFLLWNLMMSTFFIGPFFGLLSNIVTEYGVEPHQVGYLWFGSNFDCPTLVTPGTHNTLYFLPQYILHVKKLNLSVNQLAPVRCISERMNLVK